MLKLLSQAPEDEPIPDLRAQLQPFKGCSPKQIHEQLQSLHIQPDLVNPAGVLAASLTHPHSDVESSVSSNSGQSESGQTSTCSGSNSSVASSSRKSSTGSSLIALLSPTPTTQTQPTPSSSVYAYSPPSTEHVAMLHPQRRYSHQDMAGAHITPRQKRYVLS